MGFLDKLKGLFGGGSSSGSAGDPYGLPLYFKCKKCGAITRVRVDKRNDLNRDEGPGVFVLRKEVMDNKCFQLMRAEIWLDASYQVVSADVTGGELVTQAEYDAAHAAPAEE